MGIAQHIHDLVNAIFGVGVQGIGTMSRSAVAKIPNYIVIIPLGNGTEIDAVVGAKILVFRNFLIWCLVDGHVVGEIRHETVRLKENARVPVGVAHIANAHFDMVFREGFHPETHGQHCRKTVKLNGLSACIVHEILRIVLGIDAVDAHCFVSAWD